MKKKNGVKILWNSSLMFWCSGGCYGCDYNAFNFPPFLTMCIATMINHKRDSSLCNIYPRCRRLCAVASALSWRPGCVLRSWMRVLSRILILLSSMVTSLHLGSVVMVVGLLAGCSWSARCHENTKYITHCFRSTFSKHHSHSGSNIFGVFDETEMYQSFVACP